MDRNDSTEGHWLSPDPVGGDVTNPQSLNRYAYVLNNPTTFTDPLGLQKERHGCNAGDWDCIAREFCLSLYCGYTNFPSPPPDPFRLMDIPLVSGYSISTAVVGVLPGTDMSIIDIGIQPNVVGTGLDVLGSGLMGGTDSASSWWGTFAQNLVSWQATKAAQKDAWNKGYYGCIGNEIFPYKGLAAAAGAQFFEHAALEAADAGASGLAGAYYHFKYPTWFRAWGQYSKVLVPEASTTMRGVLRWVKVGGLAVTDAELAHAIYTCSGKL